MLRKLGGGCFHSRRRTDPRGLTPTNLYLLLVRTRRAIVGEHCRRGERRVRRAAQEWLVARVVVHEALDPRHRVTADRRVGAVGREMAGVVELRVGLIER